MNKELELKKNVNDLLRDGKLEEAEKLLVDNLSILKDNEFEDLLKLIKYWLNRKNLFEFKDSFENGEKLFYEWKNFELFCDNLRYLNKKSFLSIKEFVFSKIVELLIEAYRLSPVPDREILIILGEAFYSIGLIDRAIETLEYSLQLSNDGDCVKIYELLGNLYCEVGEMDIAMAYYNDLFLKYPQQIDLSLIDFPGINNVRKILEKDNFSEAELVEWLPVYCYIYEALTVKRSLDHKEYLDIKQKIIDYEKNILKNYDDKKIIIPRLINLYLWVLDYYINHKVMADASKAIIKRILYLINISEIDKKVKERIIVKAEALFKKIISVNV